MKKVKKIIPGLCVCLFVLFVGRFLWDGLFSEYIPWTRTKFESHGQYFELLLDRNNWGSSFFSNKLPTGAQNVKYYWHSEYRKEYTAYSVTLSGEVYEETIKERLEAYCTEVEPCPETMVYKATDEKVLYIEDTGWFDEEKLHYIKNVMQRPGEEKQYYFLAVVEYNTSIGKCYNGVLLNDDTKEIIEFSAELNEEACVRRLYWTFNSFMQNACDASYCRELPESVCITEYYVHRKEHDNKSGYRAAFSAEDYALVKQERMEYYQTALFECKYADDYVGERYVCSDGEKQYLNSVNLEDRRIDYLDVLMTEEEKGQFYMGCSRFKDHEKKCPYFYYRYDAVLFNDETCEMIEVSYFGPWKLEEEDELTVFEMAIGMLFLIREFFFDMLWI